MASRISLGVGSVGSRLSGFGLSAVGAAVAMGAATVSARAQQDCGSGWIHSGASGPGGRDSMAMAYDSVNARTMLFGGNVQGVHNQETWRYDGSSWLRLTPANQPSPREGSAMVFDAPRGRLVLFSGYSGLTGAGIIGGYENATWEFSTTWATRILTGPAPRAGHVMAFMPAPTSRTLMFGGGNRPNLTVPLTRLNDTWEWNGTAGTWLQRSVAGPSPRNLSAMCFDTARRVAVLFGGLADPEGLAGDTWEWDPALLTWTQVILPGPAGRYAHAMAYDPDRGVSLLFGGSSGGAEVGDTWQYAGPVGGVDGAWSQLLTPLAPAARASHGMVYDTIRHRGVLFGGVAQFVDFSDTWEANFRNWPVVYRAPGPASVEPGCSAVFSVVAGTAPVIQPVTYQWRLNGAPLSDDGRISGSSTDTLTIAGVSADDAGQYDAVISSDCGAAQTSAGALTVADPLTITDPPLSASTCPSGSAAFAVGAAGGGALSYQWQIQIDTDTWGALGADPIFLACGGSATADTPDASQTNISILPCPGVNQYQVRCVVSDECNSVTSDEATYSVCYANCDCSSEPPVLNVSDFTCFLQKFATGDAYANCDGSTTQPILNVSDFTCFLQGFAQGCP